MKLTLRPKNHRVDMLTVVTLKARGAAEAKSGALTAVFGGHFTDNQRYSVLSLCAPNDALG
jgi:hypothetical protein